MKRRILIALILIVSVFGISGFGILIRKNAQQQKSTGIEVPGVSSKADINSAVTKKSLSDLNALLEIPNVKDAIVMEVTDQKILREFDPLFARTYVGDLVVFLPDQTIVYDPTTKTVRDIMSKSFYEVVKK